MADLRDENLSPGAQPGRPAPGYGPPGAIPPSGAMPPPGPGATATPGYGPPPASPGTPADTGAPAGATGPESTAGGRRPRRVDGVDSRGRVTTSRSSAVWVGLIAAAVILILLLIFIGQNSQKVAIHYLGLSGHLSLAIALLLAAVLGALLMAVPGSVRILQLRRNLKKAAER